MLSEHVARRDAMGIAAILVLAGCGGESPAPLSPAEQEKATAAEQFEELDSRYFDASTAAVASGKKTGGEAGYVQSMNGLADANHALFQGMQQIAFPAEDAVDVKALMTATVKLETEALFEAKRPLSTKIASDLDVRNAADRKLRTDLGLDPSEVPK